MSETDNTVKLDVPERVTVTPSDVEEAMVQAISLINETIASGRATGAEIKRLALISAMGTLAALIADDQHELVGGALRFVGELLERSSGEFAEEYAKARRAAS